MVDLTSLSPELQPRASHFGLTTPKKRTHWIQVKGIQIPLTINVPKDAAPGQYITALAMETAAARTVGGSSAFKQVIRQGVPVFITVPGAIAPKFDIANGTLTKIDGGGAEITWDISNSGNVLVKVGTRDQLGI